MIFNYMRSSHDSVVDRLFGEGPPATSPGGPPLTCCIMAFVNRSGSNHIADVLKTTGRFAGFDEILNDVNIQELAAKYQVKTFADYIRRVHREQIKVPGQLWGVKAGAAQLAMLARTGMIPNLLHPYIIFVRRRDIIGQAISFLIAEQTQQWTTLDRESKKDVVYDADRILLHMRGISNSYAMLEQVLTILRLPVHTVVYEEFLDRPNDIVSRIGLSIAGDALLPHLDELRLSRQRGDLTTKFRQRFYEDLASVGWEVK
jgi:LPS sulfotransferase NodH